MRQAALIRPGDAAEPPCPAEAMPATIGSIEVFGTTAEASADFEALEAVAPASPYQTRNWLDAWIEASAPGLGVEPKIVVARDAAQRPIAILPFGLWRQGFLSVGGFLGGRDSNLNLGLFRPGPVWDRPALLGLLRGAAGQCGTSVDLFVLRNQPAEWEGSHNPLAALSGQPSPSFAHKVALGPDPEAFFRAILSKDTRKKLRRKSERLRDLGAVEHRQAVSGPERAACIEAFMRQRILRNQALGLGTADLAGLRPFLERACNPGAGPAPVEAHALHCGDRIVATFFGATHRGRFCGMSMSFDADPDLARSSPGELMLAALLESKCRAGLAVFDLGIGEARYKDIYCPTVEPLFDALVPISGRGRLFAEAERLRLQAKRSIKQSPWAWAAVQMLRRGRSGLTRLGGRPAPR